ncbi:hypothetical protein CHARACLAT_022588 [Characodon lateralis]|uniref:Uncharacterized protein n=1 Tax=Characodon lateralis TaxID=208331 RepID=A0ABU7EWX5_9TELE|nr:hypothetical protein [Characodon lateralis]
MRWTSLGSPPHSYISGGDCDYGEKILRPVRELFSSLQLLSSTRRQSTESSFSLVTFVDYTGRHSECIRPAFRHPCLSSVSSAYFGSCYQLLFTLDLTQYYIE